MENEAGYQAVRTLVINIGDTVPAETFRDDGSGVYRLNVPTYPDKYTLAATAFDRRPPLFSELPSQWVATFERVPLGWQRVS